MKRRMKDAERLARNAAALLNGEGAGGNLTDAESIAGAVECLRAALADLTNSISDMAVILCKQCEGKGYTTTQVCLDQHKSEWAMVRNNCGTCDGSGRLLQRITTELTQVGVVTAKRITEILEMDISTHNLTKAGVETLAGEIVDGLRDRNDED